MMTLFSAEKLRAHMAAHPNSDIRDNERFMAEHGYPGMSFVFDGDNLESVTGVIVRDTQDAYARMGINALRQATGNAQMLSRLDDVWADDLVFVSPAERGWNVSVLGSGTVRHFPSLDHAMRSF